MQRLPVLEFKGPVEGYVVNYIKREGWKVAASQTHDDLTQDAYLVYMKVCAKYPDVREAPHLMALFKTAWFRHFTDLANADTKNRVLTHFRDAGEDDAGDAFEPAGDSDNDGALGVALRQAPAEVAAVLNLFLSAPQEILDMVMESWGGPDRRKRANGCARLNRMLGLPPDLDALQAVHDYLS